MTVTVTTIDQGPFTATGLAQTVAYTFMTLTDEEISVFYDVGSGRVEIDLTDVVVTRNRAVDGTALEGGSVELAAPVGSSIYLRANPKIDRDLVWSDTGSRLKNLNEEQDRLTLRQLIFDDVMSRALVVDPGQPIPSPQDIIDAALAVGIKANTDGGNLTAGFRPITAFDGFGGGVVDDSNALEAAIRSGVPVIIDRPIRITRKITANRATHGFSSVHIQGTARGGRILLDGVNAGIEIEIGGLIDTNTANVMMRDLTLVPMTICTGKAIRLQSTGGIAEGNERTCILENINIAPINVGCSILVGLSFHNMRGLVLRDCQMKGGYFYGIQPNSIGVEITGSTDVIVVEMLVQNVNVSFYHTCFKASGAWEGLKFRDCAALASYIGYDFSSTNASLGISLSISGCHAFTSRVGIVAQDIKDARIYDNQIYAASGLEVVTEYYGINVGVTALAGGSAQYLQVFKNVFNGEGYYYASGAGKPATLRAISMNGNGIGGLGSYIGPNVHVGFTQGVVIGAQVSAATFSGDDIYVAVDTPMANFATAGVNRKTATPAAY